MNRYFIDGVEPIRYVTLGEVIQLAWPLAGGDMFERLGTTAQKGRFERYTRMAKRIRKMGFTIIGLNGEIM